jgi:tartrate-resistant acid phosphatase type 5
MQSLRARVVLAFVVPLALFSAAIAERALSQRWPDPGDTLVAQRPAADGWNSSSAPTPAASPGPGSVRFAVIGDFGSGSPNEAAVAKLVRSWNPDFIVAVGDDRYNNAYGSNYDTVVGRFYCDYLRGAGNGAGCAGGTSPINRFFPALGNHDYSDGGGLTEYLNYFTLPGTGITTTATSNNERYYDFVRGPLHFFVIDSLGALSNRADMIAQKNWLQKQLSASHTPWQIVVLHHAPYSSGTHGSTTAMQWPYQAWGADAVLAGHDHTYEHLQIGAIPYFVDGLGGMSRYAFGRPAAGSLKRYDADYGAMLVEANDTNITYRFISRAGAVIDSYAQSQLLPAAAATPTLQATLTATPTSTATSAHIAAPTFTATSTHIAAPTSMVTPGPALLDGPLPFWLPTFLLR